METAWLVPGVTILIVTMKESRPTTLKRLSVDLALTESVISRGQNNAINRDRAPTGQVITRWVIMMSSSLSSKKNYSDIVGTYVRVSPGGVKYIRARRHRSTPAIWLPETSPNSANESDIELDLTSIDEREHLDEIRYRQRLGGQFSFYLTAAIGCFLLFLLCFAVEGLDLAKWALLAVSIIVFAFLPWIAWRDRNARRVRLTYVLGESAESFPERIKEFLAVLTKNRVIWVEGYSFFQGKVNSDMPLSSIAGSFRVGEGAPPFFETNVRVPCLRLRETTLYFFPDRLLVYSPNYVDTESYADIAIAAGSIG